MRRWIWLLGLLVVGIAGTVWWSSRNAVRLEPLNAQRFAQMSETEQVEWLIEQVLARSKRTDTITTLLEKFPFLRESALRPLSYWEIEAIGIACVEYDLPHWLSRCQRYAETESYREHLTVYQAILQARKGDWQAAERTVQKIRTDAIRAFAGHIWDACVRKRDSWTLPSKALTRRRLYSRTLLVHCITSIGQPHWL
jgi:hypothetical protein